MKNASVISNAFSGSSLFTYVLFAIIIGVLCATTIDSMGYVRQLHDIAKEK